LDSKKWQLRKKKTAEQLDSFNGGKTRDIQRENMISDAQKYDVQLPQ